MDADELMQLLDYAAGDHYEGDMFAAASQGGDRHARARMRWAHSPVLDASSSFIPALT
jgi:hypothetical protein